MPKDQKEVGTSAKHARKEKRIEAKDKNAHHPTPIKTVEKDVSGQSLPSFPYFPVAYGWPSTGTTGKKSPYSPSVFTPNTSHSKCECCSEIKSHILDLRRSPGILGTKAEVQVLCPWCIHSGAAATTFGGCFVTNICEVEDELENDSDTTKTLTTTSATTATVPVDSDEAFMAIMERTPSFNMWTGCEWLAHCGDGCEYHGELRMDDIGSLGSATLRRFARDNQELFGGQDNDSLEGSDEEDTADDLEAMILKQGGPIPHEALSKIMEETEENEEGEEGEELQEEGGLFEMPSDDEIRETLAECYDGPGSDPAVYKFVCRHCGDTLLTCKYT